MVPVAVSTSIRRLGNLNRPLPLRLTHTSLSRTRAAFGEVVIRVKQCSHFKIMRRLLIAHNRT